MDALCSIVIIITTIFIIVINMRMREVVDGCRVPRSREQINQRLHFPFAIIIIIINVILIIVVMIIMTIIIINNKTTIFNMMITKTQKIYQQRIYLQANPLHTIIITTIIIISSISIIIFFSITIAANA